MPVHDDDRARRRVLRRRRSRGAARLPAEGRLPVGGRLLGRVRVATSGRTRSRKALPPGEYPIVDVPLDHALFHTLYDVKRSPADSVDRLLGRHRRSRRRSAAATAPCRTCAPSSTTHGRIMVLMTHNTDFGDAFEREGDDRAVFPRVRAGGLRVRRQRAALRDDALSSQQSGVSSQCGGKRSSRRSFRSAESSAAVRVWSDASMPISSASPPSCSSTTWPSTRARAGPR